MGTKQRIFLLLAILTTLFIFSNSMQPANLSSQQSGWIVLLVQKILGLLSVRMDGHLLTAIIRKCAHFTEFFLHAFWMALFFLGGKKPFPGRIIYVLFFSLFTACTDEFIQTFSAGRAGLIGDVFIDFSGAIPAVLVCLLLYYRKKRRE